MQKKFLLPLAGVLLFALVLAGCGKTESASISTDGSTSMQKVINILGEAYTDEHTKVKFTYNPTGSGAGITAVKEGRCDIGLSSRALKETEKADGLQETVLAYDGIAILVHPSNPVSDLTTEQIHKMYVGEITNWQEVGGENHEIVLIGREPNSGTRDGFESITDTKEKCKYRQELTSTGDVITSVSQNPYAVGYASLASVKDSVKVLSVGGVVPSAETIKNGTYKIQRPFVLVTVQDRKLTETAQDFFDYITSEKAQEMISDAGVVAAN